MKKSWWKSKTIWFNAIVAGLTALEANLHLVQPYVAGNMYGWAMMLLTCGNTMLRFMTSQSVGK